MEQKHHHGVVWPVLIVGAGLILLLNNLGYLSWDIWGMLWRLWPVLLIAAGLELLIGRRSFLGSCLVALFLFAILAGAVLWGVQQAPGAAAQPIFAAHATPLTTQSIQQPLEGATSAVIAVDFAAGELTLDALPESTDLVAGKIELREDEQVKPQFEIEDGVAHFTLRSAAAAIIPTLGKGNDLGATWELNLNRDVPTQLSVSTGAGKSLLDLSRLNLTDLKVEAGVGSTELFVPRRGRLTAEVDSGVGELIITIPPDVAARIEIDGGLSSVEVSGRDYRRDGDVYVSRNYDSAADRLDLRVDAGLGSIVIR